MSAGPPAPPPGLSPASPPAEVERRLDPRAVVTRVFSLSALREQWGVLLGALAAVGLNGGFRALGAASVVLLVVAVTVTIRVVEWTRFSYAVTGGRLVVRRGVVRRSLTVVPLDRVRGVDVHSSALQRLLGVAVVRVDAAATGGNSDEAVLDAVSRDEAARLRHLLLRERGPSTAGPSTVDGGSAPGPAPERVLARLRPAWLLYAPLVGGYLVAPLAAFLALQQVLDDLRVRAFDAVGDIVGERRPGPLLVATVAVALLAVCSVGAVATAAVANWGFTLSRRGGSLVSERGLLSRREVSLERARIRGWALTDTLALRVVRAARLTALVTGLGGEGSRRGQLLPLGPASVAREVAAAAVLPFDTRLRAHPPAARRRRLARAVLPWLAAAAVAAAVRQEQAAAALAVLALLGVPLGLDRYRALGHALDERAVAVRSGSLRRVLVVLDRRGVVGWQVRQSVFQRRAGLVTLTVATGAGSGGYDVLDVAAADAVALMREVNPRHVDPLVAPAPDRSPDRPPDRPPDGSPDGSPDRPPDGLADGSADGSPTEAAGRSRDRPPER